MKTGPTLAKAAGTVALLLFLVSSSGAVQSQLQITVVAATPAYPGQTVQIIVNVQVDNGTAVGNKVTFSAAKLYYPNGTTSITLSSPTIVGSQLARWTYALPANAPDGLYSFTVKATLSKFNSTWGLGSFTVNSQIATKSAVTGISTQLGTLTSNLAALSSAMKGNFTAVFSTMSTDYATLSGGITAIRTSLGTLSSDMKANFTAIAMATTSEYNALSSALSSGFGGVHSSLDRTSADLKGNFTSITGMLQTANARIANLATAASFSAMNNSIALSLDRLTSGLGGVASSAQASDLKSSLQSLASQAGLTSEIQDFVILPVVLFLLIAFVYVFFRRRSGPAATA